VGALAILLAGMLASVQGAVQPTRADVETVPIFKMRADFTVPESPAFKLVDLDESVILRPASVRELALAVSRFTDSAGGGFRLPGNVGIEVAPFLLAKSRTLTRAAYREDAWLYRARVSGAVHSSEGASRPREIAIGLRFTIRDDADPRLDTALVDKVLGILKAIAPIHQRAFRRCLGENPQDPGKCGPVVPLNADEEEQIAAQEKQISAVSDRRAQELWNASSIHVAVALSGRSADTLGNGLRSQVLAAWAAASFKAGRSGQLLVGARAGWDRDTSTDERVSRVEASIRFYLGTAHYRGFIEGQIGSEQDQEFIPWFANSGAEFRVSNSVWATGSAGYQRGSRSEKPRLARRFSLRTALPRL
jgi:hypothetical protein